MTTDRQSKAGTDLAGPRDDSALVSTVVVNPAVIAMDTPTLGDRSYLAHDGRVAVVVDPQRDIDRVMQIADEADVRITHVLETHIHNDYVTGGLALARATGASYHVNADDEVAFERTPIRDGEVVEVSPTLRLRAIATPGHTFTHLSYALEARENPVVDRLADVPDGEVWVHCAAGYRASIAASILAAHGRHVVAVDDDFDENAAPSGLPLVAA
jgi:glyoxylase-like metal-dependent hydrolase (beta-lactamase superfamily II)